MIDIDMILNSFIAAQFLWVASNSMFPPECLTTTAATQPQVGRHQRQQPAVMVLRRGVRQPLLPDPLRRQLLQFSAVERRKFKWPRTNSTPSMTRVFPVLCLGTPLATRTGPDLDKSSNIQNLLEINGCQWIATKIQKLWFCIYVMYVM